MPEIDLDTERLVREAALQWVADYQLANGPDCPVQFNQKFPVAGFPESVRLMSQEGIWKPKCLAACLSLRTSRVNTQYGDEDLGQDLIFYKYRTGGPSHHSNRALRLAAEYRLPLLYFRGVEEGYLVDAVIVSELDSRDDGVMIQLSDANFLQHADRYDRVTTDTQVIANEKIMGTREIRPGQGNFRLQVLAAYDNRCTICHFQKTLLLDAAHIKAHSDGGKMRVTNGLSLCRIHHGAYDSKMLSITPEYRVRHNRRLLDEQDGPMLELFKKLEGQHIYLPRKVSQRPDKDALNDRHKQFEEHLRQ